MDVDNVLVLELPFRTIFWKELRWNMDPGPSKLTKQAKLWDSEIEPWLNEFVKNEFRVHKDGIWFVNPQDAMLFKLTWTGYFDS